MPFVFRTTGTIEEYAAALCPRCGKRIRDHVAITVPAKNGVEIAQGLDCGVTSWELAKAGILEEIK